MMLKRLKKSRFLVTSVFGTRPEAIKFVPVLRELEQRSHRFQTSNIITAQHSSLLDELLVFFNIQSDHKLNVLKKGQSLDSLLARILSSLDKVLEEEEPDLIMVQGDTTSALGGALAAHHRKIPVVHIEAGLRSGNRFSPFPEEMNRRLITQLASFHMAATERNLRALQDENIPQDQLFLTGNPVVDALKQVLRATEPSKSLKNLLTSLENYKIIALTSHRRENFGHTMHGFMCALRDFVETNEDVALVFPVHPNPAVREECARVFTENERIKIIDPLIYPDFLHLLNQAWLIASDSGGIQEEAPSLGKPLLVMREETERPEVLECGCARLVGADPEKLRELLDEAYTGKGWLPSVKTMKNPFGEGNAGQKIVDAIEQILLSRPVKQF